ncbi:MAG: ABC-F family ATP-binding cassette domain-containing protein [Balneolales bacterium]
MTLLSTDNLSKNYGIKILFEGLTFGISKGDKTALIAQNGTGKSTLLNILAGAEPADQGEVMTRNGIHIGFLEQEPRLDDSMTISTFISQGQSEMVQIIQTYEKAVRDQAEAFNTKTQNAYQAAAAAMDAADAWDYEQRMEQVLGKLNIHDLDQSISTLSGGERKRVALAFVLLDNPDLLILDEPTNHLDVDMIEWLEAYLMKTNITLLMVTHDRYFLDRVCNHILELEGGLLYHHKGNYGYFLQKRAEREEVEQTETAKAGQLMKKELEWMRRSPKARTTKSKSRISAFHDIKEKAAIRKPDQDLRLEVNMTRIGGQVLELKKINKRFDENVILKDFSYSFNKGERIGIIGKNGVGKSTFLRIITGEETADSGEINTGSTIMYGHYRQQGLEIDEDKRVIEVLKEVAGVIELADGKRITASQFLEHFMFSPKMQYTPVSKLSGGEKRRLGLMMVLIKNPNFLILDEPTNDLDLLTLNKLEEFLIHFGGCLILVSHDRFFMDKLVDHFFIFEGEGVVRDHNGTYQEYREKLTGQDTEIKKENKAGKKPAPPPAEKKVLSYAEQKEYQNLEKEIARLEKEKAELETQIGNGALGQKDLEEKSSRYGKILEKADEKTLKWIELADKMTRS